jgi:regulator of sigma E protease
MSESKGSFNKNLRGFLWILVFAVVVYLIVRNIHVVGNVLLVVLGFGMVVIVHEFGHFVVAKLSGIKVEAFSIGFPPTLAGIRRTENGYRIRILPKFFPKEDDESGDGRLSFTVGQRAKPGETEYRIGLIPFGGFVKMLGQEDVGAAEASDDPRSFANKPVSIRIPVIAAGVTFNVISAVIIFMIVFLVGINLQPPVVGGVVPDSPAARAGLKPGDEIIEIAGKSKDLDFTNILIAGALSGKGQEVPLRVRHEDGSEEDFALVAEQLPGEPLRGFGIDLASSLTVAEVSDANMLLEKTGLLPGDRIIGVDGKNVQTYWQLLEQIQSALAPTVTLKARRADKLVEVVIPLHLSVAGSEVKSESDLSHICSMVPRLRVTAVAAIPGQLSPRSLPARIWSKLLSLVRKAGSTREDASTLPDLKSGDIIVAIADVENPTYQEMRDITVEYEGKKLPIRVLRASDDGTQEVLGLEVVPKRQPGTDRVVIGIEVALDAEHPEVAKTIAATDGPAKLDIPRGAVVTAVNGAAVSSFYDIIGEVHRHAGGRIAIDYRLGEEAAGVVSLDADTGKELITVKSMRADPIPFKRLERLYRASGPIHAIAMGYRRTVMFVVQTYMTLKRLIGRAVSPRNLMGPVGIIAVSYYFVAHRPLIDYVYFLGLISAMIAVFNLLPLPPFDGGLIVLLLLERVRGSALSERTQGIIAYAGWVLIGTFLLYVTFNDIVRSFFS